MKYARLINNNIDFAPKNKGNIFNYNTNIELMLSDGYKPFTEVSKPVTNRRYHIEYEETSEQITEVIVFNETQQEADAREEQARRDALNHLSLTKREVFLALYKDKGITPEDIRSLITDTTALIEFDYSKDFFRGNPLIEQVGLMLGYTTEQLDYLFEHKELPNVE